jgi:hypothetical protein
VDYLAGEVPRWSRENHCYSCHNNGDAAPVLFAARRQGYKHPASWDDHHGNPGFSDTNLARIQFAASLAEARLPDREPLLAAAGSLLSLQTSEGEWRVDTGGMPGAPATYGTVLATYMARETLAAARDPRFTRAIDSANRGAAWAASREHPGPEGSPARATSRQTSDAPSYGMKCIGSGTKQSVMLVPTQRQVGGR